MNLVQKLISEHLIDGAAQPGEEIALRVDQTLTEDATGLTAYQQFEALGRELAEGLVAVSLVDHSTLQLSPENAADHRYLRTFAAHYGLYYAPPGSGISHLVFVERFAKPGAVLIGADSHTPTAGAVGSLGIGVGGLELAVTMATGRFYMHMPRVIGVELRGRLRPWVGAKDVILELLRRFGVRWGVGKIVEYFGSGVESLSVPERVTITSMGAELELTASIFPADRQVRRYLAAQGRVGDFRPLAADPGAEYDDVVELDLEQIEPLIALPSSPGNVRPVRDVSGIPVEQVLVGSCTNGTYEDIALVARVLRGRKVPDGVTLAITPGTAQVYRALVESGDLAALIEAGARILEPCCGPCIGMIMRPSTGNGVSLRTYNRNFPNRSGTIGDKVYLCSPAVAAASALAGHIADPRELGEPPPIESPSAYRYRSPVMPPDAFGKAEIVYGPHHKPVPEVEPPPDTLRGRVLIVLGDEITTDHIMPARPETLAACANVEALGDLVFTRLDPEFPARARSWGGGFIVGGHNYGQGSSREHAVQGPMVLGVRAVVALSYARIHRENLINFGILPLVLADPALLDTIRQGDEWEIPGLRERISEGRPLEIRDLSQGRTLKVTCELTPRQAEILLAGGLLNYVRMTGEGRNLQDSGFCGIYGPDDAG